MNIFIIFKYKIFNTLVLILMVFMLHFSCTKTQVICSPDCSKKLYAIVEYAGMTADNGPRFFLYISPEPIDGIPTTDFFKTYYYNDAALYIDWGHDKPWVYAPSSGLSAFNQIDTNRVIVHNSFSTYSPNLITNRNTWTIIAFEDLTAENKWYCFW
jgi:hypothetical protein